MDIKELIARRELSFGADSIILELYKPYFDGKWKCAHLIRVSEIKVKTRILLGEDAFEALLLSIKVAEQFLNSMAEIEGIPILWNGRSDIALTIKLDDI